MLLKSLGLEDSESRVYEALLELGPSTVSEITKKAGITRTLGYHILEKLAINGLVDRASGEGSKIKYSANHPRSLLQFVLNKTNQWERRRKETEQLLPELISLYKIAEKPIVRYREGINGLKDCWIEALESSGEILSILDLQSFQTKEFQSYGKWWDKERSQQKIHERELLLDSPAAREWMCYFRGSFKYTEYRFIQPHQLPGINEFTSAINIFDNKVILSLMKKPNQMGIIIESSALANILKGLFELGWQAGVPAKRRKR